MRGTHQRLAPQSLRVDPQTHERGRQTLSAKRRQSIYVKGAPVETLAQCDRIHWGDEVRPLTESTAKRILEENDAMASRGLRVLAFAYRDGAELNGDALHFDGHRKAVSSILGLVALSDPMRPEVPAAIHACHTAGIRVIMVTGDYALTAASIGQQIGLGQDRAAQDIHRRGSFRNGRRRIARHSCQGETIFRPCRPRA